MKYTKLLRGKVKWAQCNAQYNEQTNLILYDEMKEKRRCPLSTITNYDHDCLSLTIMYMNKLYQLDSIKYFLASYLT